MTNGGAGKGDRKRKARGDKEREEENTAKRRGRPPAKKVRKEEKPFRLSFRHVPGECAGVLLTLGQGDTGQLGLGEDILDRTKPALVKGLEGVVDICAGGMHSVCLTREGKVFTFGCNDDGSLGRETDDDAECFNPGRVPIPGKVVQVSAGDSHSVALTEEGKAYYWGTFRDGSGPFGLTEDGDVKRTPVPLAHHLTVKYVDYYRYHYYYKL